MHPSSLIPEYLLAEHSLLPVHCFLLRLALGESRRVLVDGNILTVKASEVVSSTSKISQATGLADQTVDSCLSKLAELDLLSVLPEGNLLRFKLKGVVLPTST